jgi:hypothetical protein
VTRSIVDGQVELKRDYAGSPTAYNIRVRDLPVLDAISVTQVFWQRHKFHLYGKQRRGFDSAAVDVVHA